MDPELLSTCKQGDVKKLTELCDTHSDHEFFLTRQVSSNERSMLHVIIHHHQQHPSFIREALKVLPPEVVRKLICLPNSIGDNPLHHAAYRNSADTNAKLLVDAYKRSSDVVVGDDLPSCPPWRAENNQRKVPAQIAISCNHDEVAAFLVSVDPGIFEFVDADKLLRESVLKGCIRTVNVILRSNYRYIIEGFDPLRIENECRLSKSKSDVSLLQHHPEIANYLDRSGKTQVLGHATKMGAVDVVKTILNIDISNSYPLLIGRGNYNLLYVAAKGGYLDIAHLILDAFNKSRKRQAQDEREAGVRSNSERAAATRSLLSFQPLWSLLYNRTGETPLSAAFRNRHRELAVDMLYSDFALLSDLVGICDERPKIIPATEQRGFKDFIEGQMNEDYDKNWIMDVYVKAILRFLRENSDDNKSKKLIKLLPNLIRFKDASGRTMLQYLLDESNVDGMSLLLKIHPSAGETPDGEHVHLFTRAYRKGDLPAIHAICALFPICPQAAICHQDQTTILHNVKLRGLEEYRSLLHIHQIAQLKTTPDAFGRQPLIKAMKEGDIYLSQALLEMDGINAMDIKSIDGKTAAVLLKEKSKESDEWDFLFNKYVNQETSYIQLNTDLKEMRSTLSVVAALLATITFAAAFTVPGGFDQNNGVVLLGQRASFIVFILSDTYAMCCSMIVLCSLIWSMVLDSEEKARLLIDRSVFVLLQSLYGTLVAFMTGVYTMMSHKTLWVAIAVCVISSCVVPIIADRRIIVPVLNKVVPASRRENSRRGLDQVLVQH